MPIRIIPTTRLVSADDVLRAKCCTAIANHRKRAAADGQRLDYTADDLVRLMLETKLCYYCTMPMGWEGSEWDHKVPIARGGMHCLHNLVLVHSACNSGKGKLTATEYIALLTLIDTWHPAAREDVLRRLRAGGARYCGRKGK